MPAARRREGDGEQVPGQGGGNLEVEAGVWCLPENIAVPSFLRSHVVPSVPSVGTALPAEGSAGSGTRWSGLFPRGRFRRRETVAWEIPEESSRRFLDRVLPQQEQH